MRIISKYKDYYDFLQGIYGVDERLILDRTTSPNRAWNLDNYFDESIHYFCICDLKITGMYKDGKMLYGHEMMPYLSEYAGKYYNRWGKEVATSVQPTNLNQKHNCPIIFSDRWDGIECYPPLSVFDFHKVFDPHQMWIMLSEWLGKQNDIVLPNNQTDKEKIISHGFDLKKSFRK